MANRLSRRSKSLVAGLAAIGAAAFLIPSGASATPGASPTDTNAVQKQLGALALKNTQLVEKFNQAQVDVAAKQKAAAAAVKTAQQAEAAFEAARGDLGASAAAQYESGSFSATGALLSSDSGQNYLDQLNTLEIISEHNARIVDQLNATKAAADSAQHNAADLLKTAQAKRDALSKQRTTVQKQVNKYTTLLATLSGAQRAAFQNRLSPQADSASVMAATAGLKSASGAAAVAVKFALAQVGKPYVFGAAGPGSYDCSGLTMAAWGAAGVSLPHSAADQYNYGQHVSLNSLEPGDLIFFYQPIGHVTIYIGDGLMVSAPTEGENVKVVPVDSFGSSVTGATRL